MGNSSAVTPGCVEIRLPEAKHRMQFPRRYPQRRGMYNYFLNVQTLMFQVTHVGVLEFHADAPNGVETIIGQCATSICFVLGLAPHRKLYTQTPTGKIAIGITSKK